MTDETKLTPMQKVDELIERGKSKGGLTYKEVIDTLGNDALDVDQMEVVYDRFEDADINVVEEMVNMVSASRAYEANVTTAETTKGMISAALRI